MLIPMVIDTQALPLGVTHLGAAYRGRDRGEKVFPKNVITG